MYYTQLPLLASTSGDILEVFLVKHSLVCNQLGRFSFSKTFRPEDAGGGGAGGGGGGSVGGVGGGGGGAGVRRANIRAVGVVGKEAAQAAQGIGQTTVVRQTGAVPIFLRINILFALSTYSRLLSPLEFAPFCGESTLPSRSSRSDCLQILQQIC